LLRANGNSGVFCENSTSFARILDSNGRRLHWREFDVNIYELRLVVHVRHHWLYAAWSLNFLLTNLVSLVNPVLTRKRL